jgi:uncharacterized protein YyaL (SSP411 family)
MLYDNALLALVYLHAWQVTGEWNYRRVCEETLDYVLREMSDPAGGYYSTQDADSDGAEGTFYLWTPAEIREALGEEEAALVERVWGVLPGGNFEGRSILHMASTEAEVASELGLSETDVHTRVQQARQILYETRARRNWPGRDDKVLTAWNGFMLRAMAEAGRILDREEYRRSARSNALFLLEHLTTDQGRVYRSWRRGVAKVDAYLEDYASLVNGLLSTYESTYETMFLTRAAVYADVLIDRFWDDEASSFFDTARDHEALVGRPRELSDGATPSGTSLAAEALLRLAEFTGEERYRDVAARVLVPLAAAMVDQPSSFSHFLCALDDFIGPMQEVVLVAAPDDPSATALRRAVASRFLPRSVLAVATAGSAEGAAHAVPLLRDRVLREGKSTAYVCQGFVCRSPVTSVEDLLSQLPAQ